MFRRKSVALLLVVCDIAFCAAELSSSSSKRPTDWSENVPTLEYNTRTRRGIVIVDDDFNVSPEPGVNQGWSDGGFDAKPEKMAEEGSGKSSEMDDAASTSKYTFKTTELDDEATSKHTIETSDAATSKHAFKTSELEDGASSKHAIKTSDDAATSKQAITNSEHTIETSASKYATKTSPGKLEMGSKGTRLTHEPDIEGSGEDITIVQPATDETPSSETIPNYCLNSTCDSREIVIFPLRTEVVPEGTNVSLTCRIQVDNSTDPGTTLQWYKYNDSSEALLQASTGDQRLELTFDIPKSLVEHSGTYICIRSSGDSCCHRQLDVTVYEVPNYRYHLIIIGVVAAVSLFSCLLLAVCRNFKAKKYEVQLELQHMESDCIYKM